MKLGLLCPRCYEHLDLEKKRCACQVGYLAVSNAARRLHKLPGSLEDPAHHNSWLWRLGKHQYPVITRSARNVVQVRRVFRLDVSMLVSSLRITPRL